ncbi:transporter particle component [Kwoniella mangroviensis CBS 8886]|uniref:uncharacterized protein n=1 Tax=Kwoniella mangroviensis CBS 8507 TaxID=1296122 RepID=UPI00080D4419|nr:transporter particle component [Kwoniella mangroviensis CBS 8507]OCF70373.1 transporter particle component [Kwoniella mangroviensis CBS 8507]OCF76149.1 transporter particle component [Kwoniella mangroviensis CBS 8886]
MSSRPSTSSTHLPVPPSIPPALHQLANPAPVLIDSQLPNYLLPNVLDLLRDSSRHVIRRKREQEDSLRSEGLLPPLEKGKGKQVEDEEEKLVEDELARKVERVGLMVGGHIAEKLTLARPPLATHLDIIKFICKDLFLYVYSKQIDNLRTNHKGIFVLQSHSFPPLIPLSTYKGSSNDIEIAKSHLLFPQALLQGALVRLGMNAVVTAESSGLPQCTFQIRTIKSTIPIPSTPSTAGAGTPNLIPQQQGQAGVQRQTSDLRGSTGLGIGQAGI